MLEKQKFNVKSLIVSSALVTISLGSIGAGAYFLYQLVSSNNSNNDESYVSNGNANTYWAFEDLASHNKQDTWKHCGGLRIDERTDDGSGDTSKILGPFLLNWSRPKDAGKGMTPWIRLKDKLESRLPVGPELVGLKGIVIRAGISWASEANGFYLPSTGQIFINTDNIVATLKVLGWIDSDYRSHGDWSEFCNVVAETLFQVIYHEYSHHMAYSYLNSGNFDREKYKTKERDEKGSGRSEESWEPNFYSTFLHTLHYDDDQTQTNFAPWEWNKQWYVSIANYKNLKYLFDQTNSIQVAQSEYPDFGAPVYSGKKVKIGKVKDPKYSFIGDPLTSELPATPIDENSLIYLYSLDELVVRKMMQATFPWVSGNNIWDEPFVLTKDGWFCAPYSTSRIPTLYAEDFGYYSSTIYSNRVPGYTSVPYSQDYLFDVKPLFPGSLLGTFAGNSRPQTLYNSYINRIGYKDGYDISHVWLDNNLTVTEKNGTIPSNANGKPVDPTQTHWGKFGGFVPSKTFDQKDMQYNFVGYKDNISGVFQAIPISKHEYTYNIIAKPLVSQREDMHPHVNADSSLDNDFYVTTQSVDLKQLLSQPLYFSDDENGTNLIPMQSANPEAGSWVGNWSNQFTCHPEVVTSASGANVVVLKVGS